MAKDMLPKLGTSTKKQMFSLHAPNAKQVQLAGDFTGWQEDPIMLRKDPDGMWRASVEMEPGQHTYRFIVDGQWRDDPQCQMHIPNPFGTQDMVRKVM